MEQTVYVDLFFLINFSMDFLCFFITSKILQGPIRFLRVTIGSAVGGMYAVAALFLPLSGGASLAADLVACAAICVITYGKRGEGRALPSYILVYTAVAMTLGGFMTAFFNLLNRNGWGSEGVGIDPDGISVWLFALLAGISGVVTLLGGKFFSSKTARRSAAVTLFYGGRSLKLSAMTDTGNLLREPIGGKPCLLADAEALRSILPKEILLAAKQGSAFSVERVGTEDAKNIRLVPAKTASGEGILLALRMDRILVDGGSGAREVDAVVALTELGRSAGGYRVLLPAELLAI